MCAATAVMLAKIIHNMRLRITYNYYTNDIFLYLENADVPLPLIN